MRVAVLGTGIVGTTVASKLASLGHDVVMGSRTADNPKAAEWVAAAGGSARAGTFADAATGAEIVVNATNGHATLDVLRAAGAENLAGTVILDISNALDMSGGFPPIVGVGVGDSIGEQIQREFPAARVVKSLNTMTAAVMMQPSLVPGPHTVFLSGDDDSAKRVVRELLVSIGWPDGDILDLGGITTARGVEMYVALWVALMGPLGTPMFNIAVVRQ
jgi:8-hydroxy-5-deazaflavin:NADPH oxidoreductase